MSTGGRMPAPGRGPGVGPRPPIDTPDSVKPNLNAGNVVRPFLMKIRAVARILTFLEKNSQLFFLEVWKKMTKRKVVGQVAIYLFIIKKKFFDPYIGPKNSKICLKNQ